MEFFKIIEQLLNKINGIVWGPPLLILLIGTGVYFTFKLKLYSVTGSVFFNISVASFNKTILALSCFPFSTLTFPKDSPFVFIIFILNIFVAG